jgi:multisubunit Na+/H+ antiporter MnhC subunit
MKYFVSKHHKTRKMKFIILIILVLNQFLVLSQKKYKRSELINLFETGANLLIREKSTNKIVSNGIIEEVENDEKDEIKDEDQDQVYQVEKI